MKTQINNFQDDEKINEESNTNYTLVLSPNIWFSNKPIFVAKNSLKNIHYE